MSQEPAGDRRLSSLLRSDGSTRGRVGMVELFFDLVFVFAITQLSHTLLWLGTDDQRDMKQTSQIQKSTREAPGLQR